MRKHSVKSWTLFADHKRMVRLLFFLLAGWPRLEIRVSSTDEACGWQHRAYSSNVTWEDSWCKVFQVTKKYRGFKQCPPHLYKRPISYRPCEYAVQPVISFLREWLLRAPRHIVYIGDSQGARNFGALACSTTRLLLDRHSHLDILAESASPPTWSRTLIRYAGRDSYLRLSTTGVHNVTFTFLPLQGNWYSQADVKSVAAEHVKSALAMRPDVLLWNSGLHFHERCRHCERLHGRGKSCNAELGTQPVRKKPFCHPKEVFASVLNSFTAAVLKERKVTGDGPPIALLVETTPQHFPGPKGDYESFKRNATITHGLSEEEFKDASLVSLCQPYKAGAPLESSWRNALLRDAARKHGLGLINISDSLSPFWDAHARTGDCTHYCLGGPLFSPLFLNMAHQISLALHNNA